MIFSLSPLLWSISSEICEIIRSASLTYIRSNTDKIDLTEKEFISWKDRDVFSRYEGSEFLLIKSTDDIVKPFPLSIVFPPPQSLRSVSPSSLSFLIPPPLYSVDRLSIRLPPRISATLENSHRFYLSLSGRERAEESKEVKLCG